MSYAKNIEKIELNNITLNKCNKSIVTDQSDLETNKKIKKIFGTILNSSSTNVQI